MNLAMWLTHGSNATAINRLAPVCAIAILNVSPLGIPSDTSNPASHIVPVVPMLAPNTAAMAEGRGKNPLATKAIIAVVLSELDCHANVHRKPPKNIQ